MIRYSGYPILYQEIALEPSGALANVISSLNQAGWTIIRNEFVPGNGSYWGGGSGTMLESAKTPQGLQCRLRIWQESVGNKQVYFQFLSVGENAWNQYPMYLWPRVNSLIRIIASPYQFFTFKYNNLTETGNCVMGGVPWIPSFLAPLVITGAVNTPGNTVTIETALAHGYTGDLVNIDGALGATGLNGIFNATRVDDTHLKLANAQITGTYTAGSGVVAGPDRIARLIWSQSQGAGNGGLFHDPSRCFRYRLDCAPQGILNLDLRYNNNGLMLNQYSWVIPDDIFTGGQNQRGAVKAIKVLPYRVKWYDGSYIAHEPYIQAGETAPSNDPRVIGQLWDAMIANQNFGQLDKTISFDSRSWFVYTSVIGLEGWSGYTPDGVLLLRISN